MRVAILNRQREAFPGGDLVQIDATMAALAKLGVECEYAPEGWTLNWLRTFDLAHMFHVNFGWSVYNWQRIAEARVPYVVTPIFYPDLTLGADDITIGMMLGRAQAVMPFSRTEYHELVSAVGEECLPPMVCLVPNGTDPMFRGPLDSEGRSGVLCVAARPGDKNSETVARLCSEMEIDYRCAWGIEDRRELANVYRQSLVFVNASTSERMSLTTGEALVAGCRVIDTKGNRGSEWYGKGLVRVDPADTTRLAAWIALATHGDQWDYSPNKVAQKLTWDHVADQLALVYKQATRTDASMWRNR